MSWLAPPRALAGSASATSVAARLMRGPRSISVNVTGVGAKRNTLSQPVEMEKAPLGAFSLAGL